jgi:hypothetical protein
MDYNRQLDQLKWQIKGVIDNYFVQYPPPLRNEIITRMKFATEQGQKYLNLLYKSSFNKLSSKNTRKFVQAVRIYQYYLAETTKYIKS